MASQHSTPSLKETADIVTRYKAVSKSCTERLVKELVACQDAFSEQEVKKMNRQEVIHHVMALRSFANQTGIVKNFVTGFQSTPFVDNPSLQIQDSLAADNLNPGDTSFTAQPSTPVLKSSTPHPSASFQLPAATADSSAGIAQLLLQLQLQQAEREEKQRIQQAEREEKQRIQQAEREEKFKREQAEREERREERIRQEKREEQERLRQEKRDELQRQEQKEERLRQEKREEDERREQREAQKEERIRIDQFERDDRLRREILEAKTANQESFMKLKEAEDLKRKRDHDREQERGNRLRKANDITRGVIYPMPLSTEDLAPYLTQMDRIFDNYGVDMDLRSALLTPHLTDKARRATLAMDTAQLQDYAAWKEVILSEHRLTATAYRNQFLQAMREPGESCKQFCTRLATALQYYLAARKVTTFQQLVELIIADRLRDSLHPNTRHHVQDREQVAWLQNSKMAEVVDLFEVSRGYNQDHVGSRNNDRRQEKTASVKAINAYAPGASMTVNNSKQEYQASRQQPAQQSAQPYWKARITCVQCNKPGHTATDCWKSNSRPGQSDRKPYKQAGKIFPCFYCKLDTHSTRDCKQRPKNFPPNGCYLCGDVTHKHAVCPNSKIVRSIVHVKNQDAETSLKAVQRIQLVEKDDCKIIVSEKNDDEIETSLPREGFINIGGVTSPFICDSGTEISVINYSMIPPEFTTQEETGTYLNLQCAWGDVARAELVNVPACLDNQGGQSTILICCAVTERLHRNTALLTVEDVKALHKASGDYIPQVNIISGTGIHYTDPHYDDNQFIRRVEETIINAPDKHVREIAPMLKPSELANIQHESETTMNEFKESQQTDSTLQAAWKEAKGQESMFLIKDENQLLYRKKIIGGTVISQLVLPVGLRDKVIYAAHDALWSTHFGAKKTSQRIELYFWWPGLESQVTKYVKSCEECQKVARKTKLDKIPISPVERGIQAFDVVNIDLIGPLPVKSARSHLYVLCVICSLTRWPMAVPLKSLNAKELCDALLTLFSTCGLPRVIVSDNGTNMVSGLTQEVYNRLGIQLRTSTPYHPEGNAMVERFNQSLKKMLHHIMTSDDAKNWDKKLPFLLWSYRELPNATTKVSPHMMVFGQTPKGPLSVLKDHWTGEKPNTNQLPVKVEEYLDLLKKDLDLCHQVAADNADEMEAAYRKQYNSSAKEKDFKVGDLVLVLMPDSSQKLLSKWTGPGTITACVSKNSYHVALDSGAVKVLHANHLRKFIPRVASLGVVFEDDADFGKIETYPDGNDKFDEDLEKLDLSHLNVEQASQLRELLRNFKEVFSAKPGHCNVVQHEINLEEGFKPKPSKQYRIPDRLKADIEKQIDTLLLDGKVRHSTSEYAHPVIAVNKPDNSVRLCVDLRMVNSGTINVAYPSVIAEDILMKASASNYITLYDCTSGYWNIPMREQDIHKTAFYSSRGLLEWVYMPFGLKTASATFQRAMDIILRSHAEYSGAYIDDVIVFSLDWAAHLLHIERTLSAIKQSGLTLKLAKCHFAKSKVQFIGHIVGSGERSVVPSKVKAIQEIPEPKNKKLLRSFLGMCSFYRPYIQNFAGISTPLTDLTKKRLSDKINFNEEQRSAFNNLKKALCEATTLYAPDSSKGYVMRTDASLYAVGAALAQVNESGEEFPIAFASSKLTGPQLNWSTIEKEAYAIIFALQKFDYLVFGCKIKLFTDHNPLQYLAVSAPKSAKLTRWALSLSRYDIAVHHLPGLQNVTADCLSRCIE